MCYVTAAPQVCLQASGEWLKGSDEKGKRGVLLIMTQ
jgi:hypothetical protein